ncbi:mycofactocin-coupled SDR family oxidoreductase [Nocardioides sp. DS6]|uniref:Mycofactocin-coupled SDR family oxidoreductase n=1 Tax=Nocardioides eburneus TaxID=3231482 RepID=A0ABV3SXT8_9ACTN
MTGRLEGKVAFITGVARGQGRAHAVRLAREGADIVGIDLAGPLPGVPYDSPSPSDLEDTLHAVETVGRRALLEQGDVRDPEALRALAQRGVDELGGLDVVVANAGICIPQRWDEINAATFKDTIDINVTGAWNTVMATAPHLIARGGGSITITSSYAGRKVQPWMVHYTTSKHALVGMTRAFAAELGPHNIRVNSVHPGAVNTPMGSGDMQSAMEHAAETTPQLQAMGGVFLPRYAAEADEIAHVVAFLASDEAAFITAEQISIDGGMQHF